MELNTINNTTLKMFLFDKFKTNNSFINTILSTLLFSFITYSTNYLYNYLHDNLDVKNIFNDINIFDIKQLFYTKNTLILEVSKSYSISLYSNAESTNYSNRFKAIWNHIMLNINNNDTIFKIKEEYQIINKKNVNFNNENLDTFFVDQNKYFKLTEDIYVYTKINKKENTQSKNEAQEILLTLINIQIYSYKYTISELKNYVDDITNKYILTIKNNRKNVKFIYTLEQIKYTDSIYECWSEFKFESIRSFNNIFFNEKNKVIEKIDFFLNNKQWYIDKGIPYTLGFGLHGPPGTGKTTFIKSLANYSGRHIINISLKLIKTRKDLNNFFFEERYNEDNSKNSISFDKKIIVFEDIDCIGNIVLNRELKEVKELENKNTFENKEQNLKIENIIELLNNKNNDLTKLTCSLKDDPSDLITLDDILNLWDGLRETPGRMLVISSNYYDKLDPALIRPGRIDVTLELQNANHKIISEIYYNFFEENIDLQKLKEIKEYFYSPAELINLYISFNSPESFIERLLLNKKV